MPKQKFSLNRLTIFLSLSFVLAGLTACGGGGGGSSSSTASGASTTDSSAYTLPSAVSAVPPQN